jgi:hypothetical protein
MHSFATPSLRNRLFFALLFLLVWVAAPAQSVYAPLNPDYYHLVDRYEIKLGRLAPGFFSNIKPYERRDIAQLADSVAANHNFLSGRDRFNLTYLRNDNWEWTDSADNEGNTPIFKTFYRKKSDFYHYRDDEFEVHLNPVLHLGAGSQDGGRRLFINTRGAEIRGMIAKRIGFYSFVGENQAVFPDYSRNLTALYNAVPGEAYWKTFKTNGVDFFTARGYVTFNVVKPIQVQFGHDKNFIGNGYRSMILSDFSAPYLFLKLNTRVWRLNYQNLFAQMNGDIFNFADALFPKKYFAMHHLSVNLSKNLSVGVFESVTFGRDSIGNGQFDLNYLNPIIFYRSVEQQLGSLDNSIVGLDFRLNFLRHLQLYGQFVLDEFLLSEVRARRGWWANKQAGQLGLKYIDVAGIPNLDLQVEANVARPYTYTHETIYTSYAHYNLPLAHPLGANFYELVGILRYQPLNRLHLTGKLLYARYGEDEPGTNWGSNVRLDYATLEQVYGNKIGQGVATRTAFADLTATYMLRHNLFIDAKATVRRQESALAERSRSDYIGFLALRLNIPQRLQEF